MSRVSDNVVYLAVKGGNGVWVKFGFEIVVGPFET